MTVKKRLEKSAIHYQQTNISPIMTVIVKKYLEDNCYVVSTDRIL